MSPPKKIYAVIGDPVSHSLSPRMHKAAFQAAGLDAEYIAVHVKSDELKSFMERARKELSGFNITVPHKAAIIPYLDDISEQSKLSRSVNTVSIKDGRFYGDSTDGYGLETALKEDFGLELDKISVLFVGTGAAARAVSFYFLSKNAKGLFFANRTLSNAKPLVNELKRSYPASNLDCCSLDDSGRLDSFLNKVEVVIQSSSLGLKSDDPSPIPRECFRSGICYYDTIYKNTNFLQYAKFAGCRCADGLSMLLHQGAKSFEIWTGIPAPVEAMRKVLKSKR